MRKLALLYFIVISFSTYSQQTIAMEEEDIDMKVLTWHYGRYSGSTNPVWVLKVQNGVGYFHVTCQHNDLDLEIIYDEQGTIITEKENVPENRVPEAVVSVLDYRIVKYKFVSFLKEVQFDKRQPIATNYRVEVRTKTGGQVIYWFDGNLNLLKENLDEAYIR